MLTKISSLTLLWMPVLRMLLNLQNMKMILMKIGQKVVSSSENYTAITSKLQEEGINFETDNGSELLPITTIEVDDEAMELNKELMSKLLELDDVDAVYTDQK